MVKNNTPPDWEKHRGRQYDRSSKEEFLLPELETLDAMGEIGNLIIDVGSGAWSAVRSLTVFDARQKHPERKVICIDIASRGYQGISSLEVAYDIRLITDTTKQETQDVLGEIGRFLERDCSKPLKKKDLADTILFSEILNYVNYKEVLSGFSRYLKKGGLCIIVNMPSRGFTPLFDSQGVQSNSELRQFLLSQKFEIVTEEYPWNSGEKSDTAMMMLVVRKK